MTGCLEGPQFSGGRACVCVSVEWVIKSEKKTEKEEKVVDGKVTEREREREESWLCVREREISALAQ